MPYVITRLCRDCVDGSCVDVCPISDCIVEARSTGAAATLPNQLFINPDLCIDCAACEPECPWEAIALDDDVPRIFVDDIALNAIAAARPSDFVGAALRTRPRPAPEAVEENRRRWESAGAALVAPSDQNRSASVARSEPPTGVEKGIER